MGAFLANFFPFNLLNLSFFDPVGIFLPTPKHTLTVKTMKCNYPFTDMVGKKKEIA